MSAEAALKGLLDERIVVLDGSWGVLIQREVRGEEAYRGERFRDHPQDVAGDPDLLNLTRPDVVLDIHRRYLAAGADITTTNTFTATSIGQADYGLQSTVYELNLDGARQRYPRVAEVPFDDGTVGFACDGTPVDCVRLASLGLIEEGLALGVARIVVPEPLWLVGARVPSALVDPLHAVPVAEGQVVEVAVRVHPSMIPATHPLAAVRESFNAVFIEGEAVGQVEAIVPAPERRPGHETASPLGMGPGTG